MFEKIHIFVSHGEFASHRDFQHHIEIGRVIGQEGIVQNSGPEPRLKGCPEHVYSYSVLVRVIERICLGSDAGVKGSRTSMNNSKRMPPTSSWRRRLNATRLSGAISWIYRKRNAEQETDVSDVVKMFF